MHIGWDVGDIEYLSFVAIQTHFILGTKFQRRRFFLQLSADDAVELYCFGLCRLLFSFIWLAKPKKGTDNVMIKSVYLYTTRARGYINVLVLEAYMVSAFSASEM